MAGPMARAMRGHGRRPPLPEPGEPGAWRVAAAAEPPADNIRPPAHTVVRGATDRNIQKGQDILNVRARKTFGDFLGPFGDRL